MLKNVLTSLFYFVLLPTLSYLYFSTASEGEEVGIQKPEIERVGIIRNIGSTFDEDGTFQPYWVVKIDDHTVIVQRSNVSKLDVGKKVIMIEYTSKLFGMRRFEFDRFQTLKPLSLSKIQF